MASGRKRKLAVQDSKKKRHLSEKRRKVEAEQLGNPVEDDVASPTILTSKSVLSLHGDMSDSCLLFLERGQVICIKGKVQVQTLVGVADVFGYKLKFSGGPVNIFSSASLLVITECSENNLVKSTGLRIVMVKGLHTQSREIIKKAVTRAKNVSSVLLLKSLQTVQVEFICGIEHFQDIFHFDSGKEIHHTKAEMLLKKKTARLGFLLLEAEKERFGTLKLPVEWSAALLSVQQAQDTATDEGFRAPVILICGGKDVGKSTFARFLINSLLNRCLEVYFLECDVGQTEFTPPGIISLNKVCSPLLGPPFSHLSQPERAVFFGDVSPKDKPGFYIKCVNNVYKKYAEIYNRKIPLIINTQGWVKGMGLPILLDIIRVTEPTHVIQFSSSSQPNKNLAVLTHEFLADASGWAFPLCEDNNSSTKGNASLLSDNLPQRGHPCQVEPEQSQPVKPVILQLQSFERSDSSQCKLGASDYRALALLAYFSGVCKPPCRVLSLFAQIPYRVKWNQVAVHVMHTEVPWNQVLYSLNASVVGLAHLSAEKLVGGQEDGSAPYALQEAPIAEYLGLGIVRNIDPPKRLFYILTPVSPQTLQQVNTLLKGNLELPAKLLQTAKQSNVPYVSSNFSYDLRGAGARKVRYNLLRRNPVHSPRKTS